VLTARERKESIMVTPEEREELTAALRRQRQAISANVAAAERELEAVAAERESELEERAQADRRARVAARLDDRGKREIEEIDAALRRLGEGRYGVCVGCGDAIPIARLRALPATLRCLECAAAPSSSVGGEATPERRTAPLPGDLALLTDRELEQTLREQVRADDRIDAEELRIVCRHGTVYLTGTLPSEREHQALVKLVTDVDGIRDVDDRVTVNELPWTREDEKPRAAVPGILGELSPDVAHRYELVTSRRTEDVAESIEEDVEYSPPDVPIADEE
jgi:DnaK suppressor protein